MLASTAHPTRNRRRFRPVLDSLPDRITPGVTTAPTLAVVQAAPNNTTPTTSYPDGRPVLAPTSYSSNPMSSSFVQPVLRSSFPAPANLPVSQPPPSLSNPMTSVPVTISSS